MIVISHRGNLEGVNPEKENSLSYIAHAIHKGYEVEIDLRSKGGKLFLGHDTPDHPVTPEWLEIYRNYLWIHVKDFESLKWLTSQEVEFKYFCHESDKYCLTSNGYIWSHDLENEMTDHCIVPLLDADSVDTFSQDGFYAVCTDFAYKCDRKFNFKL